MLKNKINNFEDRILELERKIDWMYKKYNEINSAIYALRNQKIIILDKTSCIINKFEFEKGPISIPALLEDLELIKNHLNIEIIEKHKEVIVKKNP